jgi:hypothetical protein
MTNERDGKGIRKKEGKQIKKAYNRLPDEFSAGLFHCIFPAISASDPKIEGETFRA